MKFSELVPALVLTSGGSCAPDKPGCGGGNGGGEGGGKGGGVGGGKPAECPPCGQGPCKTRNGGPCK